MLDIFAGTILGIFIGLLVGIVPGLHSNLVASAIMTYSGLIAGVPPVIIASALVSMAISANFFEFLKAIMLGVPDESNVISNYPLHEMVQERKGLEAVELVALGCLGSILIAILFLPAEIYIVPYVYSKIKSFVPFLLFFIALHLTFSGKNILRSSAIFILSGLLGMYTFNMEMKDPFLPMLTGLFGVSMIFEKINEEVPAQFERVAKAFERKDMIKSMLLGFLSASTLSFIPAIGPAQASLLSEELRRGKETDKKNIIVSVAGVNTADVFFSLLTLRTIDKARSGVLVALSELVDITALFNTLILSVLIASIGSYFVFKFTAGYMVKNMHRLNMKIMYSIALLIIISLVYSINGSAGLWILFLSTMTGKLTNKWNVRNSQMMGCLILPTLIFYF